MAITGLKVFFLGGGVKNMVVVRQSSHLFTYLDSEVSRMHDLKEEEQKGFREIYHGP